MSAHNLRCALLLYIHVNCGNKELTIPTMLIVSTKYLNYIIFYVSLGQLSLAVYLEQNVNQF